MALGAVAAVLSTEAVDPRQVSMALTKWAYTGSHGSGACFLSCSCIAPWKIWERGGTDSCTVRIPLSRQGCAAAAAAAANTPLFLQIERRKAKQMSGCVLRGSGLGAWVSGRFSISPILRRAT